MTCRRSIVAVACWLAWSTPASGQDRFVEVAAELGVVFDHRDYRTGEKYYVETTGSGGGWLDFDADGDLDLYLLNGAAPPGIAAPAAGNALFENREGRFVDVTAETGTGDTAFGMGLCVGDFDADGRLDFAVTNYGPDRLYRQVADGSFVDVAVAAGVAGSGWSSSCAFGDLDGDGDLDLYVTHYVDFDYASAPDCGDPGTRRKFYCQPTAFAGVADSLFVNQGEGRFTEEGRNRGIQTDPTEKGLGVLLSDLDGDGDLEIYVANDGTPNRLYVNDGTGRFVDQALLSGTAVNALGQLEASMGVDGGDVDGDGRLDLVLTHFALETNTLYRARDTLQFDDLSRRSGVGPPSQRLVSWGVKFFDADNDGDLDLAVVNGHIEDDLHLIEPGLAYEQPRLLFENLGDGTFREISVLSGEVWSRRRVGRALATGDFNNDGRVDLLITNTNGRAEILENRWRTGNHWLGLALEGPPGNPSAIGALVRLTAGPRSQIREVRSGTGFQSQSDLRLHFGLGTHNGPVHLEIMWPNGERQIETTEVLDRYWLIRHETDRSTRPDRAGGGDS